MGPGFRSNLFLAIQVEYRPVSYSANVVSDNAKLLPPMQTMFNKLNHAEKKGVTRGPRTTLRVIANAVCPSVIKTLVGRRKFPLLIYPCAIDTASAPLSPRMSLSHSPLRWGAIRHGPFWQNLGRPCIHALTDHH